MTGILHGMCQSDIECLEANMITMYKISNWKQFCVSQRMPFINLDELTDKDKAQMELDQKKIEVKLERWLVRKPIIIWYYY